MIVAANAYLVFHLRLILYCGDLCLAHGKKRCSAAVLHIRDVYKRQAVDRLGQRIDSTFEIALLKLLTARSVILRPVNRHRYAVLDFIVNSFRGSGTVNIIPSVIPNQPLRICLRKLREQRTQILTGACLVKPHNFTDPDRAPCLPLLPERLL